MENKCLENDIISELSRYRYFFSNEKQLQYQICEILNKKFDNIKKEYKLDNNSIIDFFIDGIGLEVKIKGSVQNIYRQCKRYCMFEEIETLIVVGTRNYPINDLNGKRVIVFNIGLMAL